MAQKPSVPQAVPNAKESPATPTWLFLFYQWVVEKIDTFTSIFSTTDFVVGTASSDLGAERVATDTASIDVDIGTSGQIKWSVIDEYVQDLVGALVVDSAELDFTYTDATPDLTAVLKTTGVTAASYGSASAVGTFTVDSKGRLTAAADASISITSAQVSDFSEAAQDAVGGILTDSPPVDCTYNDGAGTITAAVLPAGVDHGGLAGLSDDDHTQYYLVSAARGMNGADFNRVAANPGDADTLWMDDGTTYATGTLVAPMPAVFLDEVSFGAPGFEQGHIIVNGATYDALVKVNEFGGTRDASLILHRHHSTNSVGASLVFAKASTDDETHAVVADGERLGEIVATGHDGTDYAQSSAVRFEVDGTPGSNDMPGRIVFLTSSDGGQSPTERLRVDAAGILTLANPSTTATLRFMEPSGGANYTEFKAQAQAGNVTYILPSADATVSGYALKSDGAGNLSWGW